MLHLVAKYVRELAFGVISTTVRDDGRFRLLSAFHAAFLSRRHVRMVIGQVCPVPTYPTPLRTITALWQATLNYFGTCDTGDPLNIHVDVAFYINLTASAYNWAVCLWRLGGALV